MTKTLGLLSRIFKKLKSKNGSPFRIKLTEVPTKKNGVADQNLHQLLLKMYVAEHTKR